MSPLAVVGNQRSERSWLPSPGQQGKRSRWNRSVPAAGLQPLSLSLRTAPERRSRPRASGGSAPGRRRGRGGRDWNGKALLGARSHSASAIQGTRAVLQLRLEGMRDSRAGEGRAGPSVGVGLQSSTCLKLSKSRPELSLSTGLGYSGTGKVRSVRGL